MLEAIDKWAFIEKLAQSGTKTLVVNFRVNIAKHSVGFFG
jgi:hypothetical protein